MSPRVIEVAPDFWNIRGSFKIAGLVDVGTQASLVRRANGRFVLLDSVALRDEVEQEVLRLTNGGADVEAILNLHPFHTIYVAKMLAKFPKAQLYGTARHVKRAPDLPWEPLRTEDPELHERFAEDFDFSIPEGVDFISKNEHIHFSSVLAYHRASKTIHVDDTLNYIRLPKAARFLGRRDSVTLQPTLPFALEKRAGAAAELRDWCRGLAERWNDAENLCAAHSAALLGARNEGAPIPERILQALRKVEGKLASHERKHG